MARTVSMPASACGAGSGASSMAVVRSEAGDAQRLLFGGGFGRGRLGAVDARGLARSAAAVGRWASCGAGRRCFGGDRGPALQEERIHRHAGRHKQESSTAQSAPALGSLSQLLHSPPSSDRHYSKRFLNEVLTDAVQQWIRGCLVHDGDAYNSRQVFAASHRLPLPDRDDCLLALSVRGALDEHGRASRQ